MATIPIEVIVQDKASPEPTPTPSDSGETNIVVPDTGAGVVGSGSTFASSSVASIILPAILLIVALVTMCILLIRKRHKRHDNDKFSKKEKLITAASTIIAVLSATVLVGNLVIPATKAATSVEPGTAELDTVDKITITAAREIDSDITVATVKNTSYATANLDFGYKVTASMIEGATTANLYLDGDKTSEYYIAPVTDGTLTDNTWGYALSEDAEGYLSMALADSPAIIVKGNDAVENESVDIYYTIRVDKSLPAGTYTGEIEYTLTDNNFPATLTTMQGMTTEICENTYTPGNQVTDPVPTATLEDTRDNKTYTIAKLADGKCWMTQNLDLDLSTEITLTPADTDVSSSWTPERNTISPEDLSTDTWQYDQSHPYSYNPGDVYYYTSGTDEPDTFYSSLELCMEDHSEADCKHYHAGNYYNWSAAVASNDTSSMVEGYSVIGTSVCPKGWRIPTGPNNEGEASGEMYDMLASYSEIVEEGQYKAIRTKPFWLVRSGRVYYGGSVNGAAWEGYYWGSTVESSGYAYGLLFGSSDIHYPGENKMAGYTIRCVAR